MKLTLSSDLGLMSQEADYDGMFKGVDEAQTFLAMVSLHIEECQARSKLTSFRLW
jgi:hypothetical protein